MSWLIAVMGSGVLFLYGALLLMLAVVIRAACHRRWAGVCAIATATCATIAIGFSATPLPNWLYALWGVTLATWLFAPTIKVRGRRAAVSVEGALLALIVAMLVAELPYEVTPFIRARGLPRLYVIGDSITAGIGGGHGRTWPAILHQEHGVEVVDLSHAGAGAADELHYIRNVPLSSGLVLLEIGGNDMLGHRNPNQFGRDLDALIQHAAGPGRVAAMLELPLFPFDNAYGLEQRRVARRRGVILIPRRYFAGVLSARGATIDGVHLSPSGHQLMAEMIWELVLCHTMILG